MTEYLAAIVRQIKHQSDAQVLHDILEGADFGPNLEGVELTNAQAWANLLLMGAEEREKWFAMVRDASAAGRRCFLHDHDGTVDNYNLAVAAAAVQRDEAETYYKRMRTALTIAHSWRAAARGAARETERLKKIVDNVEGRIW
jgi:DnaJ-domain-containing protein 1